ncbi:MAG: pyridoxal phosphate-dependent aminotransferase [Candidatus Adiutrix sp.]|jgi:aspartate aminotransferase|nr:pyridoxal phosphate-dependent aminotransferase [Candidatus Adiutrix sp.]
MRQLADRIDLIAPSPTLALDAKAKALKAAGQDVISFGIGEPDFNTPDHIREAAIKAIRDGFTRYTPADGILELKEAVCAKFRRDNRLGYQPGQVVISNGGKHTLYNIFLCLFQPGDEVIVPAPAWVSYEPMLHLVGARPVLVKTSPDNGYTLTPAELEAAITPQTRGLVINSPSNPTGMTYGAGRLKELAAVILRHDLWVVSDDIYEKLIYDDCQFANLPMIEPALYDRTVIAHGLSKTYAMTGWRVGFLAGPEKVARSVAKVQSQTTSNPCSISQKAAVAALNGPQETVGEMVKSFSRRRDLVLRLLADIPGVTCPKPQGAFYVFPDISAYFGKKSGEQVLKTSDDLAGYLLDKAGTAIVPGSGFGDDHTLRLSYAVSDEDIVRGLGRVKEALLALK